MKHETNNQIPFFCLAAFLVRKSSKPGANLFLAAKMKKHVYCLQSPYSRVK
jgi:hypothetical protein